MIVQQQCIQKNGKGERGADWVEIEDDEVEDGEVGRWSEEDVSGCPGRIHWEGREVGGCGKGEGENKTYQKWPVGVGGRG